MARLFADENFPNPTVEGLRQLGHDVLTVADVDLAGLGIPDEEVLAFATRRPSRADTQIGASLDRLRKLGSNRCVVPVVRFWEGEPGEPRHHPARTGGACSSGPVNGDLINL